MATPVVTCVEHCDNHDGLVNKMYTCKDLCRTLRNAPLQCGAYFYFMGYKRCKVCSLLIYTEATRCPCCNSNLHVRPKSRRAKANYDKLVAESAQIRYVDNGQTKTNVPPSQRILHIQETPNKQTSVNDEINYSTTELHEDIIRKVRRAQSQARDILNLLGRKDTL